MRPKIILICTILTTIIFSCHRIYLIPDKDKKWLPYKGNEVLVFSDNNNNFDTVTLMGFETTQVNLDSRSVEAEQIKLISLYKDSDTSNVNHGGRIRSAFLFQTAGRQNNSYIGLNFYANNARFSPTQSYTPNFFDTAATMSLATRFKKCDDVIILLPDSIDNSEFNYRQRGNFISKLYWSKSEGIVRYDKNINSWELIDKYGR